MIVSRAKNDHSFIIFSNLNAMICIFEIKFDKINNVYQTIKRFLN